MKITKPKTTEVAAAVNPGIEPPALVDGATQRAALIGEAYVLNRQLQQLIQQTNAHQNRLNTIDIQVDAIDRVLATTPTPAQD